MPLPIRVDLESPPRESFRASQVAGMFGLEPEAAARVTIEAEVPGPDDDWTIGAIVGPSGSGKTTLARAAFGQALHEPTEWRRDQAVIDQVGGESIRRITAMLTAVGLGSAPAWLRAHHELSTGEQFRCELARVLLRGGELVVFDEFTSVVDRTVARSAASAVGKAIRRGDACRRFVAVTCHRDILPWLDPDWTLDPTDGRLDWRRLRRPPLRLSVRRCRQHVWRAFARHHYLSHQLPRAASCFVALDRERPAAFCATCGMYGRKGAKRVARVVALPEYQGLGIGGRLLERVAAHERGRGFRVHLTASHPAMIRHCLASSNWRLTNVAEAGRPSRQWFRGIRVKGSAGRGVVSFRYEPAEPRSGGECEEAHGARA